MRRRTVIFGAAAVLAAASLPVASSYRAALANARQAVATGGLLASTRFGALEYAVAGEGPPLMMLHGTGGGWDQGLLFAGRLIAAGWQVIAPSRFGYLRSDMPPDASPANQADALAGLLDTLGVERLPVIGGSAGAIPAVEFAIRHPDRCAALVALVPAAFAPGRPPMRPNPVGAAIMRFGLRSDLLFWAGTRLAEDAMFGTLLATDPALVHAAAADEQARVRLILRSILPISDRVRGLMMDAALAGNPSPQALERISAPTLALSLEDDRFLTLDAARHIAASVPGARLVSYPTGGHVWVGRDAHVSAEIDGFLRTQPAA